MSDAARRWLIYTLFAIWCLSVSLTIYKLFAPWPQVIVTAGVVFVMVGGLVGLVGEKPGTNRTGKGGESHG